MNLSWPQSHLELEDSFHTFDTARNGLVRPIVSSGLLARSQTTPRGQTRIHTFGASWSCAYLGVYIYQARAQAFSSLAAATRKENEPPEWRAPHAPLVRA